MSQSGIESRIADLIVAVLRDRDESLGPDDLNRPVAELDLDSLDLVELHQHLERALRVRGDLNDTARFAYLSDYTAYFSKLASQG
ncbi:acyl carrier protein [Catenulispora subtropica]|uniref:Carrier domain-containing protein n=1 Tax=Catenulispora subtropica TaxID=450798 RepID=A0ABN2SF04_9ACTN